MEALYTDTNQKVARYYSRLRTRLGYLIVLGGAKHMGYYPNGTADISEREAQLHMQDMIARKLELHEKQLVLEAGCGEGAVSTYLARKYGAHIVGITITPFEIKSAQARAKRLGVSNKVEYKFMDYSATGFPDNYFDSIYTSETLSHSPDILKTLGEFYRILKPGGTIALFEYTIAPDEQFTHDEKNWLDFNIEHAALFGLKSFRHDFFPALIRQTGFVEEKELNISAQVLPSVYRLHKIARFVYPLVQLFGAKQFINTFAAYHWFTYIKNGLFRYCIFTARKPFR